MVETLKLTLCIEMSMNINSFLYLLKRIPILRSALLQVGYEHNSVTKGFVIISVIYEAIKMILKVLLLLMLGIVLPMLFVQYQYGNYQLQDTYYHMYLTLYLLLPFTVDRVLSPSPRKFICVKVMKMNAKSFVIADYVPQDVLRILVEVTLFSIVAKIFNLNIIIVLFLILSKHFYMIAYEALHLASYQVTGKFFHKRITFVSIYMLLVLAIGYSFALLHQVLHLSNIILVAIGSLGIAAGICGGRYLLRYSFYHLAFNDANIISELGIDKNKTKAEAGFARVKLQEKEFSKEELTSNKHANKIGYEYLNAIFFERHKRVLTRPIRIQLLCIGIVFSVGFITILVFKEIKLEFIDSILQRFPLVIFISYMMSTGLKATKAMFYNCDISLLRYGFYRESTAVLSTFTLRVKNVIITNLIPAGTLALGLFILELLAGGNGRSLLPVELLILIMSIFFSVHNMMLYYLLQPYTSDLNVKNPMFTIINSVTYILSYLCFQMKTAPENFLFYTVLGTAIYTIVALFLVYRLAPRTFKVK